MVKRGWFDRHVRKFNWVLLAAIILVNAYVIVTPFLPQVTFQVHKAFSEPVKVDTPEARVAIDRSTDRLIVPGINLEQKIWFGRDPNLVHKGVWHIPKSSTPDRGSNTVLAGHRWTYRDDAVFYHLDKVSTGDPLVMVYDGKLYTFRVFEKKIVEPTDVYIEDPSEETRLTLYTCHPLWSNKQRLVVVAELEAVE